VQTFMDHTPLVGPAIFLACDLSVHVTGSIVMADGGCRTV